MTEKILLYHRFFIVCFCLTILLFFISLIIFVRFKIYKGVSLWSERRIKKDCQKPREKIKKEEKDEQTIYMSNAETVELAGGHGSCVKRNAD